MPRIRPIRTEKEAENIPPDQPLDIELAPEEPKEVEIEPRWVAAEGELVVPKAEEPEPEEPKVEEPDLRQRLADLQKAETENLRRRELEKAEWERQLREARTAQSQSLSERNDAYYAGILNAIDAAEAQADVANRQIDVATEAGDKETAAVARRNLAKAEVALSRYEEQKAQYEELRKTPAEPRVETHQQQNGLEAAIAQYPAEAQKRFRKYPEYVTDPRKTAKLVHEHWNALEAGHSQYSAAYFKFLDDHVFEPKPPLEERIEEKVDQIRRSAVPAAPPTRDVPSASTGRPQSTRVTLTPEEREIARQSKSKYQTTAEAELEYARQKLKYQEAKRSGQYQERG